MNLGKNSVVYLTTSLLILIGFCTFIFLNGTDKSKEPPQENNSSSENSSINIVNNIQNNITSNGDVVVNTTVNNEVNTDQSVSIDNSLQNDLSGSGHAKIFNQVENDLSEGTTGLLNNMLNNNVDGMVIKNLKNDLVNNLGIQTEIQVNNSVENRNTPKKSSENKDNNGGESNGSDGNGNDGEDNEGTPPEGLGEIVWGIDSASETTEEFTMCVRENFGEPVIYGRYLGDREDVSRGLTAEQVDLIHGEGAYILPIYNQFSDATGFDNGVSQAEGAINLANELGIPNGVAIFADIEPTYPVDSEFIRGWFETINKSQYSSGIYGVFDPESELVAAYNAASEENPDILETNIIWTASPNVGITTKANAPDEFTPDAPENALALGWQYGIDAEACNIDTNLFDSQIVNSLWAPES